MNLNENKGTTFGCLGAIIAIIAVIANLAQILDWLGIKPKEKQTADTSSSVADADVPYGEFVAPETNNDNNSVVIEEVAETEAIAPPEDYQPKVVNLADLDYFNSGGEEFNNGGVEDNIGEYHAKALISDDGYNYPGLPYPPTVGYIQYYLNKKYTELSGMLFVIYDDRSDDYETIVEFLGDGVSLGTFSFTAGVLPKDFLIDVADVDVLEINYNGNCRIGIDATLKTAE